MTDFVFVYWDYESLDTGARDSARRVQHPSLHWLFKKDYVQWVDLLYFDLPSML